MHQFDLDAGNKSAVNPLLGCHPTGLTDDGAQIAFGEAHAFGIVAYLVVLCTLLVDELQEAVEDGLFARLRGLKHVGVVPIGSIVEVHHGGNKTADRLPIVVGLMNHVPDGVDDVAGGGDIGVADFHLEVAHLSVEGRWHLRHGEVIK